MVLVSGVLPNWKITSSGNLEPASTLQINLFHGRVSKSSNPWPTQVSYAIKLMIAWIVKFPNKSTVKCTESLLLPYNVKTAMRICGRISTSQPLFVTLLLPVLNFISPPPWRLFCRNSSITIVIKHKLDDRVPFTEETKILLFATDFTTILRPPTHCVPQALSPMVQYIQRLKHEAHYSPQCSAK